MPQDSLLDQNVAQVMKTLPSFLRKYLAEGKYTPIAKDLMAKYGLRIDQGGVLERETMLLLMGIENPNEFMQSLLEEAKLDQRTVSGIMQDINTQIFIPLRDEMRKGPPPVAPVSSASRSPQSHFHLENKIPIQPQPNHSASHKPALRDVLASVMKAPPDTNTVSVEPHKLLADHEEPHIEFGKLSFAPPENLPGTSRPPKTAPLAPAPESRTQPPKPLAPAAPAKPYSVDPYREPFDEK